MGKHIHKGKGPPEHGEGCCFANNTCYGTTDWVASGEIQDPTLLIFGVTAIFGLHTMLLP